MTNTDRGLIRNTGFRGCRVSDTWNDADSLRSSGRGEVEKRRDGVSWPSRRSAAASTRRADRFILRDSIVYGRQRRSEDGRGTRRIRDRWRCSWADVRCHQKWFSCKSPSLSLLPLFFRCLALWEDRLCSTFECLKHPLLKVDFHVDFGVDVKLRGWKIW